jgi:hypothetical protein
VEDEDVPYLQIFLNQVVSNISCIGVFSSLILGLWCKCIEVGFENWLDMFYSRATAISVEHKS